MKQILAITLTLVMMLVALTGCMASKNPSGNEGEQKQLSKYLSEVDGVYKLTLPNSKEEIELNNDEVRFVPYVTDALVETAENKITEDIAEFNNHSDFYLQITEDYLCLTVEVIEQLGSSASEVDGCGLDHKHIFFSERISSQSVKELSNQEHGLTKSSVIYYSDENETTALSALVWSKHDDGNGNFTETKGNGIKGSFPAKDDSEQLNIPELFTYQYGNIKTKVPVNGQITHIYLLDMTDRKNYPMTETTWNEIEAFAPGRYFIVTQVLLDGNCDPDAPQHSFLYEDLFCLVVQEPTHTGYEVEIELMQYTWDGWGVSTKTVGTCDVAYNIIDALKSMKETGKTVPKISDDVLEIGGGQYPVERGTMWIESSGKIYRLTPDLSQICLVETHFGEGKVLEITDEFKTNVNNAWHYAPYDYYKGTYQSGDKTVELNCVFRSASSVELRITKIQVENKYDPKNTISVELISKENQTVSIKLHCQKSDDNLASGDGKTVKLINGVPVTVDLNFGGWNDSRYWIYLEVDNVKAEIMIVP